LKQILQNLSDGKTTLVDVPCPQVKQGSLLISTSKSLLSAGTERMIVNFGKANMLNKARQQPDKVKMVLGKVKNDGLLATYDSVRSKLDQPLALGYCNAGVVIESTIDDFSIGDRVVSNGNHAEIVRAPKNLCAKIPDNVDDESASFTVLGAIGLQGIRLIKPTLGECFVITGLGLIGLMCVQILRANGCRVLGIDFDSNKCDIAREYGAETVNLSKKEDPILIAHNFSRGRGVDGVLITASSESNEVMQQSAKMCRIRGRIVLIGVVGLNLRRDDFYKKEISFQVSSSYGPGRYDHFYEDKGNDYPVGFVRWTVQRNFEAVLDMMSSGALNIKSLITHRYQIENAIEAYEILDDSRALGILLEYSRQKDESFRNPTISLSDTKFNYKTSDVVVGFIGAGNYASRILIPAFADAGAKLDTLATSGGISGVHHGNKAKFQTTTTQLDTLWKNNNINTITIVTKHDMHALQVIESLNAGKHVFVEKPLALTLDDIDLIDKAYQKVNNSNMVRLMVGFNRRFAPHIIKMKELLTARTSPKSIIMTINAGPIPIDHWVQDGLIGGGRIIGEACHFIDLMCHLVGKNIKSYHATMIGNAPGIDLREDKASIVLSFEDGSFGTIHYLANGGSSFPKERIEVFCDDAVLQMDNYRVLRGYDWSGFNKMRLLKQDKGQKACAKAFIDSIRAGEPTPISYSEIMQSSRISIEVSNFLRKSNL
jgi:predicted dehydrogenase/threonine dehydrogenase-like Zn-dependent dehydrogenase